MLGVRLVLITLVLLVLGMIGFAITPPAGRNRSFAQPQLPGPGIPAPANPGAANPADPPAVADPPPIRKPVQVLGDLRFAASNGVTAVALSPDAKLFATGGNAGYRFSSSKDVKSLSPVFLWDAATGKQIARLDGHEKLVNRIVFAPDSQTLYTGGSVSTPTISEPDQVLRVWDCAHHKQLRRFQATHWSLTPDGRTLLTVESLHGLADGLNPVPARFAIHVWDTQTWKEVWSYDEVGQMLASAAITPDGRSIACGTLDGKVRMWDRTTSKEHPALAGMKESVHLLAFSPDGKTLAAASEWAFSGEQVRPVVLWDWAAGRELRRLNGHTAAILTVVFTPDGKHIITGSRDRTARAWEAATGEEAARLSQDRWGYVHCLSVSADGKTVYVADGGLRPRFVDFASRKEIALDPPIAKPPVTLPFPTAGELPSSRWVDHECAIPGSQVLRTGPGDQDWGVRLVDLPSGKTVRHFAAGWVVVFDCTPDGKTLATYGHLARDGSHRATAVQLWDIATGKQVGTVGSNDPRPDYALRFSPDGKLLAVRHHGGTVGLWDVATGKQVLRLEADGWWPGPFTFSRDGRFLVSGSKDSPLLVVWDISTDGK